MTSKKDSFYSGADKCDFACLVLAAVKYTAESTSNVPNKTGTLCAKWNFLWFGFYLPRKQPETGMPERNRLFKKGALRLYGGGLTF